MPSSALPRKAAPSVCQAASRLRDYSKRNYRFNPRLEVVADVRDFDLASSGPWNRA